MGQLGFFDAEDKLADLSKMGDPLERMNQFIKWDIFRRDLTKAFRKEKKSPAGRPPFDYLMMFKVLILQSMYGLSDAQTQYQILDRHTFKRFLGLSDESAIPDEKTIWHFREVLNRQNLVKRLFDRFDAHLAKMGYSARRGQIVDASFVEVPIQRNSRDENDSIKKGETPPDWEEDPDKLRQKDVDARWTQKNGDDIYGYKDHVNVDVEHKLIREYEVTPANVHDSQMLDSLLDPDNSRQAIWGDSAYRSKEIENGLRRRRVKSHIHRKGNRGRALTLFQELMNRRRSRIRARIEHVFGVMEKISGMYIRCIGIARAKVKIGLMNLVYNLRRYVYLGGLRLSMKNS